MGGVSLCLLRVFIHHLLFLVVCGKSGLMFQTSCARVCVYAMVFQTSCARVCVSAMAFQTSCARVCVDGMVLLEWQTTHKLADLA